MNVDDDNSWTIRVREGSCRLDIDLEGKVEFAADERTIARVSPGGRLRILERRRGVERELVAKAGPGGAPQVAFELDGDEHPYDEAARAWLARLLPEIFRQTGIDAHGRVGRILARGGVDAVLAESRLIRSDYVQRIYLTELLAQAKPGPQQVERVVDLAARGIDSDYDLAELLVAALGSQGSSAVVGNAFGAACAAIDSDYDLRRVLVEVVAKAKEPAPVERALGCARGIGSDYDRAELLIAVVPRWPRGRALGDQVYTLARGLSSDYDRRRTLQAAAQRRPLPEEDVRRLLASADAFGSDYDLAELLVSVAGAAHFEGELAAAFERAAAHIGSDYDRKRALAAIGRDHDG
jgi:bla regulator protein blaR1